MAQLATALAGAHSVGVLHKDIKPANVLIAGGAEGRLQVRLADFGIGAVTERERLAAAGITELGLTAKTEEESSSYSGTRLYMAPELLEGRRATLQADVYALGVVLYQAVVGELTKALAPGWRRDVDDELLCEDIAYAVDGSPERRLGNALRIAERLRSLEARRQEREAERQEREQARRAREALSRSRKRRKSSMSKVNTTKPSRFFAALLRFWRRPGEQRIPKLRWWRGISVLSTWVWSVWRTRSAFSVARSTSEKRCWIRNILIKPGVITTSPRFIRFRAVIGKQSSGTSSQRKSGRKHWVRSITP